MKMNNREYIIVTGGYGFIGSRFIKHVIERTDFNVVLIDSKTYAADPKRISDWLDPVKHHGRVSHYTADIAHPKLNKKVGGWFDKASYVVNFAAETHVDNSISDGSPFMDTNIQGVFNLLEICRNAPLLRKFVQISTDEVYGDMESLRPFATGADESFQLRPSSYYSASKAAADLLVQSCAHTYGLPYLITRSCNNFGTGQHPEKFIPKMVSRVEDREPIPVYGDGKQIREWMNVDMNVSYIYQLMVRPEKNEVFNIGSGELTENREIISLVEDVIGHSVEVEHVADRLGHDKKYHLDSTKLRKAVPIPDVWGETLRDFFEFELADTMHDEYFAR